MNVYLEVGSRRVFAGALDWPGWCRSGKADEDALEALKDYAARYREVVAEAPKASALKVVERLKGNATTDFGAPGVPPTYDDRPLGPKELRRQISILEACWSALDAAVKEHRGSKLRKGPRGGGRELLAIRDHVNDADRAYLSQVGGVYRGNDIAELREAIVEAIRARARNEPPAKPKRSGKLWTPRYTIRRSAWHALDHAWEIEDRAT